MRVLVVALTSLVLASHGRRLHESSQISEQADEATPDALKAFATLLLSASPAAGYQGGLLPTTRTVMPRSSAISMGLAVGETFPADALADWGIKGQNTVVFFYGADDAPSCSKEIAAFEGVLDELNAKGVSVVGVRNAAGEKESTDTPLKLVVDDDDAVRNEIGIEKDLFGLLGGRETYVLDKAGTVIAVHNNQFDPESHIDKALDGVEQIPEDPGPFDFLQDIFNR